MKKTLSCCIALTALLVVANAAAQGAAPTPLRLKQGHSLVLDVAQLDKIAVGDPKVADIKALGEGGILVVGEKEGKTELRAWTKKKALLVWEVTVVAASAAATDLTPSETKVIEVKVGARVTLAEKSLARVAVGDPDYADIEASKEGITVKGLKAGSTTLIVWLEGGKREVSEVRVTP